jgi:hypothetical protein
MWPHGADKRAVPADVERLRRLRAAISECLKETQEVRKADPGSEARQHG